MDTHLSILSAIYEGLLAWQTLIGALIALAAALWTIGVMRDQMKADTDRHREAQKRKNLASRARMPDALSELAAYVRGSGARLVGITDDEPPEPIAAITTLKEVIEFIDDKAAKRTFELVSWYQVFRARNSHGVPHPQKAEFADRQYDATLLHAYINSLFEYARNEAEDVDLSMPSLEDMDDALKNAFNMIHMTQHEELYAGVKDIIKRRHQASGQRY